MSPSLLSRGDAVGVVAPGFAVRQRALRAGIWRIESMGFRVVVGDHVFDREGYLAGTDENRAKDLNGMLADRSIRGVWFARGGYGSTRLLDKIEWRRLWRDPKVLIGYSDITAIHAVANKRTSAPCLHGPVVVELGDSDAYHAPSLRALLRGQEVTIRFAKRQIVRPGRAEGRLAGGNLAVLVHLLGTRFAPDLRGAILFLEDVGEPVYRLDRMLCQLRSSGVLAGVTAVVLGAMEPAKHRTWLKDRPLSDLVRETFLPLGVPVVVGIAAGHVGGKRTVPIGGRARLDTPRGNLRLEPCFEAPGGRGR